MNKLYPILLAENLEKLKEGKLSNSLNDSSIVANGFLQRVLGSVPNQD